jgi:hypothetical protein
MRLVFAVLLVAGCGKSNAVTAPGTVLVDWDHTKARAEYAKATVGPHTAKNYTVTVSPQDTPPFVLTAHVEFADVDFVDKSGPVHQRGPVAFKVTVRDNTGWDLSGKCDDGPVYQMPFSGPDGGLVTPLGMRQDCTIKERRVTGMIASRSWDIGFTFNVMGDGTITPFPDTDVKIE